MGASPFYMILDSSSSYLPQTKRGLRVDSLSMMDFLDWLGYP